MLIWSLDLIPVKSMIHLSDQKETFKSVFSMALHLYTVTVGHRYSFQVGDTQTGLLLRLWRESELEREIIQGGICLTTVISYRKRPFFKAQLLVETHQCVSVLKKVYRP